MGNKRLKGMPDSLDRARQRFQKWRRERKPGTRIPDPLWEVAVKEASNHGLNRTAKVLKLDYYGLKKRMLEKSDEEQPEATFVSLLPWNGGECLIEFEDQRGARMRVHLKGGSPPDLIALGRDFWSRD